MRQGLFKPPFTFHICVQLAFQPSPSSTSSGVSFACADYGNHIMTTLADLPNEILLEIMWLLVLGCRSIRRYTTYSDRARMKGLSSSEWGFLTVTQVCSRWRQLAISTPILWSLIDLADEAATLMCIERARSLAPLHVVSTNSTLEHPVALPDLCNTASVGQLQSLSLRLSAREDVGVRELIDNISATWMPHLRALRLALTPGRVSETIFNIQIGKEIAPQLESLTLHRLRPNISLHSWDRLRNLDISFCDFPQELEIKIFLSAFGTHNSLEQLSISNILLRGSSHGGAIGHTDSYFPNLELLSLCMCSKIPLFLSSIGRCPRLEKTFIKFPQFVPGTTTHDTTIPSEFIQHLPLSRRDVPLMLTIDIEGGHLQTLVKEISSTPTELSFLATRREPGEVLERIARMLGHLRIQRISLWDYFGPMEQTYTTFFNAFPHTEVLDLPLGGRHILPMLGSKTSDPSHNIPAIFFPSLRQIYLTLPHGGEENMVKDLLTCVSARSAQSACVANIEKLGIYYMESAIQSIRTYLSDLERLVGSIEYRLF